MLAGVHYKTVFEVLVLSVNVMYNVQHKNTLIAAPLLISWSVGLKQWLFTAGNPLKYKFEERRKS